MARPESEPFSFFRMVRAPNRTSRLSSSMTGGMCLAIRSRLLRCSVFLAGHLPATVECRGESSLHQQVHRAAERSHLNPAGFGVCCYQGRADFAGNLTHLFLIARRDV